MKKTVFDLRFMEGGALVESWNKTDFIPQRDTVVKLKNGISYKVKGVVIHRPPKGYLRLSLSVIVEATVTKEE